MRITWFGQSAYLVSTPEATVAIDPHGDVDSLRARGMQFDYEPMGGIEADVLLITHEHADHNGEDKVGGEPETHRSTAGTFDSPALGRIEGIACEHDRRAGTERGACVTFCFELDGRRLCHLADLGQAALRPEQLEAIGSPDVLFVPVGGGPTIGAEEASEIVRQLRPSVLIPMHYRTLALNFLEPVEPFLDALGAVGAEVVHLDDNAWDEDGTAGDGPRVVVPTPPVDTTRQA